MFDLPILYYFEYTSSYNYFVYTNSYILHNDIILFRIYELVLNERIILIRYTSLFEFYFYCTHYYPPNPLSLGSVFFFGPLNAGNSIIPLRGGVLG